MVIRGRCHCGNISFTLAWEPDPVEIPSRACDCTFCSKHGGAWTSNPAAALQVAIQDASLVPGYSFGTRTATFHVCGRCGVPPIVTSTIDGHLYAVVNVNCFDNVDPALVKPAAASFEGEDVAARLARRKRNWIGNVSGLTP